MLQHLGPLLPPAMVLLSLMPLSLLLLYHWLSLIHLAPPRMPLCLSLLHPLPHLSLLPLSLLPLHPLMPPPPWMTLLNLALALPPPHLTMLLRYVGVPACTTYTHHQCSSSWCSCSCFSPYVNHVLVHSLPPLYVPCSALPAVSIMMDMLLICHACQSVPCTTIQ